jgi:hypothetical protein
MQQLPLFPPEPETGDISSDEIEELPEDLSEEFNQLHEQTVEENDVS